MNPDHFTTGNHSIQRYVWWSSLDGILYNGSMEAVDIVNLSAGYHTISFMVQDENGTWSEILSRPLLIHQTPVSFIEQITPDPAILGEPVRFFGRGIDDGPIERYIWWSSLDGELYNGSDPSFSISGLSKGNHTIRFRVRDESMVWSDHVETRLMVHERPETHITSILPDPALDTDDIRFVGYGRDDGTITGYAWRSNLDGEFYNGSKADFTYSDLSIGNHTLYFRVMDENLAWSHGTWIEFTVHRRPEAYIESAFPRVALDADMVTLKGQGIDDGTITQYSWESNLQGELYNGTQGEVFRTGDLVPGNHTLSLRVRDNHGVWSSEAVHWIMIHTRPVASIENITPSWIYDSDLVEFHAGGTDDGEIHTYLWNSSVTGTLYHGPDPSFSIRDLPIGEHRITLTVQDNYGIWSKERTTWFTVHQWPEASIQSIHPISAQEHEEVHFIAKTGPDIIRYSWTSSLDGEIFNGSNPTFGHPILSNGSHIITLRVMDGNGVWSDMDSMELAVNGIPRIDAIRITPEPRMEGIPVSFEAVVHDDGSVQRYVWISSRSGIIYDGPNASFTQSDLSIGIHTLSLRIEDDQGVWSVPYSSELQISQYIPPNTIPTIEIISPTGTVPFMGIISGTAHDTDGVIEHVEISVNGGNWTMVHGTNNWTLDIRPLIDGTDQDVLMIKVRAFDGEDRSEVVWLTVNTTDIQEIDGNDPHDTKEDEEDDDGFVGIQRNTILLILIVLLFILHLCLFLPWEQWMK